jgi:hypothetical protein
MFAHWSIRYKLLSLLLLLGVKMFFVLHGQLHPVEVVR